MANSFDFARAQAQTPAQMGWCQRYAEQGFGLNGRYPNAAAAAAAVPAASRYTGSPPNDGNYYLLYFAPFFNGEAGDVAVYRNGSVWSGANYPSWRAQDDPTTLANYKQWVGRTFLYWSDFLGSVDILIGVTPEAPTDPEWNEGDDWGQDPPFLQRRNAQRKRSYYNYCKRANKL